MVTVGINIEVESGKKICSLNTLFEVIKENLQIPVEFEEYRFSLEF